MNIAERMREARVDQVRDARVARERAEAVLHRRLRLAAAAGVSERKLAEASGLSRAKVRSIIGRERP